MDTRSRTFRAAGVALPALTALALLGWSWRRWPDILIDFGRELYTPWQLTLGRHLYRDLAWFNGPFSAYFNAGCFRAFGVSLMTLVWMNLAILAGIVWLLHRLMSSMAGARAALAGVLVFLAVFAFTQGDEHGNYNYVCPYSHELTHGLFLALLVLWCLFHYAREGRRVTAAFAGLALGLITLTKTEVCLGAWLAIAAGWGMLLALKIRPPRRLAADGLLLVGLAAIPPLAAWLLLSGAMPARQAAAGLLFPYRALFLKSLTTSSFYRFGMGMDDISGNLAKMLLWTGVIMVVLLPGVLLGRTCRPMRKDTPGAARGEPAAAIATDAVGSAAGIAPTVVGSAGVASAAVVACAAVASAGMLVLISRVLPLAELPRALPLVVLLVAAMLLRRVGRRSGAGSILLAQRLTFATFAFVLLWKTILRANVYHYGFVLSMPAAMLSVCALVEWLPEWAVRIAGRSERAEVAGQSAAEEVRAVRRGNAPARLLRAAGLAFLGGLIVLHLGNTRRWYSAQHEVVASGGDGIRTDIRGVITNRALAEIGREVAPKQTLAVFPEGVMLNYLARRSSSIPFINFMPPELALFGEDAILAALDAHRPDFIAFFYRPANEYGYRGLGTDYGVRIADWIRRHYAPVTTIEGAPGAQLFGRMVFLRRAEADRGP